MSRGGWLFGGIVGVVLATAVGYWLLYDGVPPPTVSQPEKFETELSRRFEEMRTDLEETADQPAWAGCYQSGHMFEGTILCLSPTTGYWWHAWADYFPSEVGNGGWGDYEFDGTLITMTWSPGQRVAPILAEPLIREVWAGRRLLIPIGSLNTFCSDEGWGSSSDFYFTHQDDELIRPQTIVLSGRPGICSGHGA